MKEAAARAPWWWVSVALSLAALLLSCALLAAYLGNGQDLALVRNSLVYELTDSETPFTAPPVERASSPSADPIWHEAAHTAGALDGTRTDLERGLSLVRHLDQPGTPHGGMIALPSIDTYRIIKDTGRGYCADYTGVFLALAKAAGLTAREWGISFNGYSGAGHALVEIYARDIQSWVMLDVFNGFYLTDEYQRPLSLPALRLRILRGEREGLNIVQVADVLPFTSPARALQYLERGLARAYLWVDDGHSHSLLDAISRHSRALAQLLAIAGGQAPRMLLMPAPAQRPAVLELRLLRLACVTALVSALLLVLLCGWARRRSRQHADIAP